MPPFCFYAHSHEQAQVSVSAAGRSSRAHRSRAGDDLRTKLTRSTRLGPLSSCAVLLALQTWLYCGGCSKDSLFLKTSIGVLVVLNSVKVVCELWRMILIYGVHLAEATVYTSEWRRHLQDPIILIA